MNRDLFLNKFKTKTMADDKSKQGTGDDIRIDANDASEVEYAAKKSGVTSAEIREAITKVGNLRADVEAYFKK